MSVLLYPPLELRPTGGVDGVGGGVRGRVGAEDSPVSRRRIKWPNDVLLKGRKVCGILIEQGCGTVAGIGLNVRQTPEEFDRLGLPMATSLTQWVPTNLHTYTVARQLIQQLDEDYSRLVQGNLATLEACWKWRIGLLGQQVAAEGPRQTVCGRLLDLTFAGVEIQLPTGAVVRLAPEAVQQLKAVENY